MLVYQSLDLIDEYTKIKTKKTQQSMTKLYNENTYLGLIFEGHIGELEFDLYGYVTNTRYKYILMKNDNHSTFRDL